MPLPVSVDSPLEVSPVVEVTGIGPVLDDAAPSVVMDVSVVVMPVVGASVLCAVLVDEVVELVPSEPVAVVLSCGAPGPHAAIIKQLIAIRCILGNVAFGGAGLTELSRLARYGRVPCFTRRAHEFMRPVTDGRQPGHRWPFGVAQRDRRGRLLDRRCQDGELFRLDDHLDRMPLGARTTSSRSWSTATATAAMTSCSRCPTSVVHPQVELTLGAEPVVLSLDRRLRGPAALRRDDNGTEKDESDDRGPFIDRYRLNP